MPITSERFIPSVDMLVLINSPRLNANPAKATGLYPHLGIRAIESFMAVECPSLETICLDGEIFTYEDIRRALGALINRARRPLVGFSTVLGNYQTSLNLACWAKQTNPDAVTVMGGPWATELPHHIMATAPEVDFVVRGDGETPLLAIVAGRHELGHPGLVSRAPASSTERSIVPAEYLPWPLNRLTSLAPYHQNYCEVYPGATFRPAPVFFKKYGCDQRCPYCAIPKVAMRPRTPLDAWKEVTSIFERLGANHFWDVSDNADVEFWEEVAELAPKFNRSGELSFFTFVSPERVTPEFVSAFRRAGGIKVFIGFDSNDTDILKRLKAGRSTAEHNLRAIRLVKENGLFLDASFIMAPPHETPASMAATVRFIEDEVANYERLTLLLTPILTPLPGTHYWSRYFGRDPVLRKKYLGSPEHFTWPRPTWTIDELQRDYLVSSPELFVDIESVLEERERLAAVRPDVFSTWSDRPARRIA